MFPFKLFLGLCCSVGCCLTTSATAETRNLAFQQSATSNSELQPAYRAFDGSASSRWESEFGFDDVQLTVDLGDIYQLQEIIINWEAANASDFALEASNDLNNWTVLATMTNASAGERTDAFNVNGQYRYIRMAGNQRSTQYGYSIWEMSVNGDDALTDSVLLSTQVVASSSASIQAANLAFDGNDNTRWESVHEQDPAYLIANLGRAYELAEIVVQWEAANAESYEIQGSNDGSVWQPLASYTGGIFGSRTDTLSISGQYQYVRLYGSNRSEGNSWGYSIWEMDLYGYPNAEEPGNTADGDNDGISDDTDQCPNSPVGTDVDTIGCAIQTSYPNDVFFIGNSFTYYGPVPQLVEEMAQYAGFTDVTTEYRAIGGASLTLHRNDADVLGAPSQLQAGWDAVVLQDQSTRPTNSGNPAGFYDDATWFYDQIKSVRADTEVFLYETWAWRYDSSLFPDRFVTPEQMQQELNYHYHYAAEQYIPSHSQQAVIDPITVVPVGEAWALDLLNGETDGRLHDGDNHHAGALGQYLNALVFYSTLFDRNSTGMIPLGDITQSEADHLQSIANSVTNKTGVGVDGNTIEALA